LLSAPEMMLKAVDLLEPLGPISPTISPSRTSSERPSRARKPPKLFLTSCSSSMTVIRSDPDAQHCPAVRDSVSWPAPPRASADIIKLPDIGKGNVAGSSDAPRSGPAAEYQFSLYS